MHAKLLKKPILWQEGYVIPSTEPGLGYELDESVALEYAYDVSDNTLWPPLMDEPLIRER
jgi:L-alanine-DL-glutamate epimerase-like enolase superfamily enzyme